MIRVLGTFLAFILWCATSADAAPIGAAIAALSSAWASAGLLIKIGVMLAINVGVGLIEQYRARKAAAKRGNDQQPRGVTLQVQMGDTLPRTYLLGTRATAGYRKYAGIWGAEAGTPNAYFVDVREISCLPSHAGAAGLQSVRIADQQVTVLWSQPHPDGRGYPVQEYRANGVDYLWIKYLDGTQTEADPYLRAQFGGHSTRPWKSTMIGRGCQTVIVTLRRNQDLFKNGLPEMLFVPAPMRLYDPRKDSTNGGSGSHRWGVPSTFEPSDNLPLMAYNVARGIYYDGRWVHGGRNFAAHRLPPSSWMSAMNEADRIVGDRHQFRGGLEVAVNESGLDILEKIRVGCVGRYAEVGGSLKMLVGAPAAAVWTITDETIVVTRDQDFEPFPTSKKAVNTVRATYPEPALGWRQKEAPEWSSAALLARDGGEQLSIDVDIDVVSDAAQVQCVVTTMAEEAQRWRTHRAVLPPSARVLEPNDVISWSSARNSYADKKFMVSRIGRLTGCLWQVIVQEIDPSDYDPPAVILPPVTGPTGSIPVPPQLMLGWEAVKATVNDNAGVPRRPAIRVSCTPELEDVSAVHVQIRVKDTGALVFDNSGSTPYPAAGSGGDYAWLLTGTWCVAKGTYLVRGRLVPLSTRPTLWSEDIEVTVDDIVMTDVAAELAQIGQDVRNVFKGLRESFNDARSQIDRLQTDLQLQGATAERSRQRLAVQVEDASASFDEQITVIANSTKAIAEQLVDILAKVGSISAQGRMRFEAVADPQGALARYSLQLRVSDSSSTWYDTGFYSQIVNDGGAIRSEFAIMADRFVVLNPDDPSLKYEPMVFEEGKLKLALAHIVRLETGFIGKEGGKIEIDVDAGRWVVRS